MQLIAVKEAKSQEFKKGKSALVCYIYRHRVTTTYFVFSSAEGLNVRP